MLMISVGRVGVLPHAAALIDRVGSYDGIGVGSSTRSDDPAGQLDGAIPFFEAIFFQENAARKSSLQVRRG
jgi:hypothetical protein